MDDILVQAESLEVLQDRLEKLMVNLEKQNIIVSNKKFVVSDTLTYGGYVIDSSRENLPPFIPIQVG